MVDSGCLRKSNTLSVNSAEKIGSMVRLFARTKFKKGIFQPSENVYFENLSGPNLVPFNRHRVQENV